MEQLFTREEVAEQSGLLPASPPANRRPTQCERVLELLADGGWHPTLEFIELGILRAPARVHELRRRGLQIDVRRLSRHGRSPIFAYRLRSDQLQVAA